MWDANARSGAHVAGDISNSEWEEYGKGVFNRRDRTTRRG
jgi:hypothetical protein